VPATHGSSDPLRDEPLNFATGTPMRRIRGPGGGEVVSLIALVVFVLTCSAVGLRLLLLAAHGGGGPAWSCGLGFTFIALLGYPMSTISGVGLVPVGDVKHGLAAAGTLLVAAGLSSFFAFTLTTFRLQTWWAWVLTLGSILTLAFAGFAQIDVLARADRAASSAEVIFGWSRLTGVVSSVCYAWLGAEGLLEWSKSKRRLALGLTDPVVSNRFLMWGLFGASTTCLNVFLLALTMISPDGSRSLAGQVGMSVFGLVASATAALAFFPPRSYQARLRARAAAAGAS